MQASEPLRHQGAYHCGEMGLGNRMNESTSQLGTDRTFSHIAPTETVFLHRKVGGIYMLAVQLKARVDIAQSFLPFAIDLKTT